MTEAVKTGAQSLGKNDFLKIFDVKTQHNLFVKRSERPYDDLFDLHLGIALGSGYFPDYTLDILKKDRYQTEEEHNKKSITSAA